jgi:ABC-type multidrug transport system fused ATPase/permease subunit
MCPALPVDLAKQVFVLLCTGWPRSGVITFDNVWMKYGPSCPYALKGVSFTLGHSDKVGVVGRTGSGKSTLLLALYRMFELDKGAIIVDGVNVATLKLREVRHLYTDLHIHLLQLSTCGQLGRCRL